MRYFALILIGSLFFSSIAPVHIADNYEPNGETDVPRTCWLDDSVDYA